MNIPFDAYQERVVLEKIELDQQIAKLDHFVDGEGIKCVLAPDRELLYKQMSAMRQYSTILGDRITRFICAALLKAKW